MSEENTTQTDSATTDPGSVPEPPVLEDPTPDPEPTPPAPTAEPITWEPATWYSITYACLTAGCPNQNVVGSAPMFYSNDGNPVHIRVFDSVCRTDSKILTATKLDPQPVEE